MPERTPGSSYCARWFRTPPRAPQRRTASTLQLAAGGEMNLRFPHMCTARIMRDPPAFSAAAMNERMNAHQIQPNVS
ncbi:hypothetical protein FQA47_006817 [Oryzias melastigma]|uniref:Uncharacterized protein n=1 Tax=Oryzias melastigma TaxID=30732 RepID=A0A834FE15_ORYME|nr:hypothetical protein FQA47_006817 [Oryzias melastigma]